VPRLKTVDDAIAAVRSICDERNVLGPVKDTTDILPSLNRAQTYAFNILARLYEEPLVQQYIYVPTGITVEIPMPENIFEDRVQKIEAKNGDYYYPIPRASYRDLTLYESFSTTTIPSFYAIYGRTIRLAPKASGVYHYRIWYLREPEELVPSQGRITKVGTDYVVVEGLGTALTTIDDTLNNYVNVVDGQTGELKASLQISSIVGSKVTFRTVPTRTTVVNRTITGTVSSVVQQDDYLCQIGGICVPFFAFPMYNFIVEHAAAEMKRKMGGDSLAEDKLKAEFEKQIEHDWVGREASLKVFKRNRIWQRRPLSYRR
jgi:hypothetical protein